MKQFISPLAHCISGEFSGKNRKRFEYKNSLPGASGSSRLKMVIAIIFVLCFTSAFSQIPVKQWDARFGGSADDFLFSVHQTSDGGYILGGYSESGISGDKTQDSRGSSDYWIVKTDADGNKQWDLRFGGSSVDQLTAMQQTADGGYILGGFSYSGASGDKSQSSRGQDDYWIVKIDANGVKQWDARFGGKLYDELHALQQTADGGYILGGFSRSHVSGDQTNQSKGGSDYWIVKTDANGVKQWDARFGGNKDESLNALTQTADGGYLLGGFSLSGINGDKTQASQGLRDYWIVKTDANGVKQWDAAFGGSDDDWLTDLHQTTDGGYILGGWSWSQASGDKTQNTQGDNDYWIVKTDANGVKQWDADFGGNSNDYLNPVQQTPDGGYILGGYSSSGISGDKTQASIGGVDYWMVKTDADGKKQWDVQFGGTDFDFLNALDQTKDGGYILGGYSYSGIGGDKSQASQGLNDYWVVKTDAGIACEAPLNPQTTQVTANGAILTWENVDGATGYAVTYKSNSSQPPVVNTRDNQVILNGLTSGTKYVWRVKTVCSTSPDISSAWSDKQTFTTLNTRLNSSSETTFEVYPNPVSQFAAVQFSLDQESPVLMEIMDISGRSLKVICDATFAQGNHQLKFNSSSLSSGAYFLRMKTNDGVMLKKFLVQ